MEDLQGIGERIRSMDEFNKKMNQKIDNNINNANK